MNMRMAVGMVLTAMVVAALGAELSPKVMKLSLDQVRTLVEQSDRAGMVASAEIVQPLMDEAREQCPELLGEGALHDAAMGSRWSDWERTIKPLDAEQRKQTCEQAYHQYAALRRAFMTAFTSNDVRAMAILAFDAEFAYRQIDSLVPDETKSDMPLPVNDASDLRAEYTNAVHELRLKWLRTIEPDRDQRVALVAMMRALTLAPHVALIENARTNTKTTVSIGWLSRVYRVLAQQEPMNLAFWYGWATTMRLEGQPLIENSIWRSELDRFPNSRYAHYRLACSCGESRKEAERAIVHLRWLLPRVTTRDWLMRINHEIAHRYYQYGDPKTALAYAREAAERAGSPLTDATLPLYLGAKEIESGALLRLGMADEAVRALDEAVVAAPRNGSIKRTMADTLFNLAAVSEGKDQEHVDAALLWYDKVLADNQQCTAAHAHKAYLYMLLGLYEKAQKEAVQELAIDPQSAFALSILGFTHLSGGQTTNALLFFNKALDFDPAYKAARNGRDALAAPDEPPASPRRSVVEDEPQKTDDGQDNGGDHDYRREKSLP